ncbi:MAG: peptidase [Oceanospirillaceae bacterium]|nr:peptidase [Oceanospirillaceae bacterium]MAY00395.1 peptidase [Oceanospirillaceae bacterium]MBL34005.1 peptidase [Oceanospirillaceae bacterium]MBS52009.1 peptidase [Oceanospirillaceae bacterium]
MTKSHLLLRFIFWLGMSIIAGTGIVSLAVYLYLAPTLPDTQELKDVELQTPLRVFTADGQLISEFGEKRRTPITYAETPPQFINALLASEDDSFFEHFGIDIKGLARAAFELIRTGRKKSGGSTITMQVAKNYYLSSEKTFTRKFTEILLALKIERDLSKEEILELYINKIYLGKRAYGIEAAAQVYYGKSIKDLDLAQLAMIAGLPQAPSAANPINNPRRAIDRRNYVLARMRTLDKISEEEFDKAARSPVTARYHGPISEVEAPYIAEMVRRDIVERFGEDAYTAGYNVYTTVDGKRQQAANRALQSGLLTYDRAHGYRKPKPVVGISMLTVADDPALKEWLGKANPSFDIDWPESLDLWDEHLRNLDSRGIISPAIVSRVAENGIWYYDGSDERWLPFSAMEWAKPYVDVNIIGNPVSKPDEVVSAGDEIWIEDTGNGPLLAQLPEVEGALVSLNPKDGGIQALVGGFSYGSTKFNRVIQADRQPGSSFKPFIYSSALANGYTPASIINDAPVVFEDKSLENTWRPENHSGKFYGPTRLRQALYKSQNLVSIRILKQVGPRKAVNFITPFGFPREKLNPDLSLALGASAVTPMELATGYSVLANGGYSVQPYLISRIEDDEGNVLFSADPAVVCKDCEQQQTEEENTNSQQADIATLDGVATAESLTDQEPALNIAPRVMDARVNYLMVSMLRDVVRLGTGKRALALKRADIAGKTGTTNDQKDAWFSGFSPDLVTTVWVGFDQPVTLGRWAYGSNTALPIWVDYMETALQGVPEHPFEQPEGIVSARIDPATGLLAAPGQENAMFEYFREENVPKEMVKPASAETDSDHDGQQEVIPEQLF